MALKINPITGKFNLWKSAPDWNQNDEIATDYIKNRTHYETIAEHVEMTDEEYNAKVESGSKFVQVKIDSVTVESNEYLKDESSETGNRQEYNSILSALSVGNDGHVFKNGTSTCKKIAINGIETTLEYLEHPQGSGSPFYDREGVLGDTFYGANGTSDYTMTNLICCYGNGFMFKYYSHTYHDKGYFLYLIDKTIYGEAPYTIDFYFECEQTIKKLDEKYLPDSVLAKEPKFKTGDVVYMASKKDNGTLRIIDWDTYKENPSNYEAIGLVVDPVKRTFLFAQLSDYLFSTEEGRELLGNSSFDDGMETRTRISGLSGNNLAATFPIFYKMQSHGNDSVFYPRCWWDASNPQYYVPALNEWKKAYNSLCSAFYDDPNDKSSPCGSAMDRVVAYRKGANLSNGMFFLNNTSGMDGRFYSQLSTIGINQSKAKRMFGLLGHINYLEDSSLNTSPVFGIYTEEEENA